jgi:hypothetical protein
MQNTFSRSLKLDATTEKKFYFKPDKTGGKFQYQVHINNDLEVKKFTLNKDGGSWKIQPQTVKLPEWLFTLEGQFNDNIEEALANQK